MSKTSQYSFTIISEKKETPKITLEPSDEKPAIPGDLALKLNDKVTLEDADKLRQSLNANVSGVSYTNRINTSDVVAGWIIGTYLVLHTLLLVGVSLLAWLPLDWDQFFDIPFLDAPTNPLAKDLAIEKFGLFQRLVLSACAAGLGGGVYMIREFFIKFAYGRENEYLVREEIPRYILLPFSSVVLGPISLALAKAGTITFAGLSSGTDVPMFTLVALSFVLGFTYHDTLAGLAKLSESIFTSKKKSDDSKSSKDPKAQQVAQPDSQKPRTG